MSKELKPCPFCGCTNITHNSTTGVNWIYCADCGVETPTLNGAQAAEEYWNTRPIEAELSARIERLEALIAEVEWVEMPDYDNFGEYYYRCPFCKSYRISLEEIEAGLKPHAPDCPAFGDK